MDNLAWKIGNGKNINLCKDNLCDKSLVSLIQIPNSSLHNLDVKLSVIIQENSILLPSN